MIKRTGKLLLAASLGLGGIMTVLPVSVQAEAAMDAPIGSTAQVIDRAYALHLIPEGAKPSAKQDGDRWDVTFVSDAKDEYGLPLHVGEVALSAIDGKLLRYSASLKSTFRGQPGDDPNDESLMVFTVEEAQAIAAKFVERQDWQLDDDWMFDPYPVAGRETRFEVKRFPNIRFARSHDGIRDGQDSVVVRVDRRTGEIDSFYVKWEARAYIPDTASKAAWIDTVAAGKIFYNTIQPFLKWQALMDPDRPRLVYALHAQYLMTPDGKFPKEYQWENPPFAEKVKPAYSGELAKARLLSMYDLTTEYVDGKLAYKLRLKPEITFFLDGLHPVLDAHTGEWLDFLNQPLEEPLPPASDWLIQAAPAGRIDYAAAVVWDNELLRLQDEPIIEKGRTLVPFRELLEKLGAEIAWDPVARKVTAGKDGTRIELAVDSDTVFINGEANKLEAPARIRNGRTYIPARLVLETFGAKVGWNPESRLVLVSIADSLPAPSPEELRRHRFQAQLDWENKASGHS